MIEDLKKLRNEINKKDKLLLKVLSERLKIVKKIGLIKKKEKLPVLQSTYWTKVLEDKIKLGNRLKLDSGFTKSLMKLIHKESVRIQKLIKNNIKG